MRNTFHSNVPHKNASFCLSFSKTVFSFYGVISKDVRRFWATEEV